MEWAAIPSAVDEKVKADSDDSTAGYLADKVDNSTIAVNTSNHYLYILDSPKWGGYSRGDAQTIGGNITIGGTLKVGGNNIIDSAGNTIFVLGNPTTLYKKINPSADNSIELGTWNTYRWFSVNAYRVKTVHLNPDIDQDISVFYNSPNSPDRLFILGRKAADTSNTLIDSAKLVFRGSYWDSSNGVAQFWDATIFLNMTGTPSGEIVFKFGTTERIRFNSLGDINLDGDVVTGGYIKIGNNKIYDSAGYDIITLGSPTIIKYGLQINGNTIADSGGTTRITLGSIITLSGDVKITGNDIIDSDGVTRITMGGTVVIYGDLKVTGNDLLGSDGAYWWAWDPDADVTGTLYDCSIGGDLMVTGNLSVGGSKNAVTASKSGLYTPITASALESPFTSGVYIITQVETKDGKQIIDLPLEFTEAINGPIFVLATPREKTIVWVNVTDNQAIVYSEIDTIVDVFIWGRRWDVEVMEDVARQVWYSENNL